MEWLSFNERERVFSFASYSRRIPIHIMYYFMLFCSINSESSELTLKSPKKVNFKYLDDALKEKQSVECWTLHALNCCSFKLRRASGCQTPLFYDKITFIHWTVECRVHHRVFRKYAFIVQHYLKRLSTF